MNTQQNLTVIDGETLIDKRLPPTRFCVESLIPQGLCILGGAPKVGKSWFVLDLCVHIARGEPLWEFPVTKGEVLYFCLEDSERRIQERLNIVTDDVPPGLYFATGNTSIESGLCDFIRKFKQEHPDVTFVAIDTFQLIRTPTPDVSYGGDYAELRVLKELADELGICLLLVHHLRKMNDKDPVNKLSGSTGIFESSILRQEKALAPFVAIAPQLRTAEPTKNPHEIGLFGVLDSCVFAGASYATWRLCWRLLFEKMPKSHVLSACLAGTNPGTSGAFCGANPKFCESED